MFVVQHFAVISLQNS